METVRRYTDPSSASLGVELVNDYSPTTRQSGVIAGGRARPDLEHEALASAVYGYITAVRALGRQAINTGEIAAALGLTLDQVASTLVTLQTKRIKVIP